MTLSLLLVLAACGGGDDDGVATLEEEDASAEEDSDDRDRSSEDATLEFVACLREQGIEVEDPQFDEDGIPQIDFDQIEGIQELPGFDEAQAECEDLFDDVLSAVGIDQQELAALADGYVDFAACMREKGFSMPDPNPATGLPDPAQIPFNDSGFQETAGECIQDTDFTVPQIGNGGDGE